MYNQFQVFKALIVTRFKCNKRNNILKCISFIKNCYREWATFSIFVFLYLIFGSYCIALESKILFPSGKYSPETGYVYEDPKNKLPFDTYEVSTPPIRFIVHERHIETIVPTSLAANMRIKETFWEEKNQEIFLVIDLLCDIQGEQLPRRTLELSWMLPRSLPSIPIKVLYRFFELKPEPEPEYNDFEIRNRQNMEQKPRKNYLIHPRAGTAFPPESSKR